MIVTSRGKVCNLTEEATVTERMKRNGFAGRELLAGAAHGALAWIVYGAVELDIMLPDSPVPARYRTAVVAMGPDRAGMGRIRDLRTAGRSGWHDGSRQNQATWKRLLHQFVACLTLVLAFILNLGRACPIIGCLEILELIVSYRLAICRSLPDPIQTIVLTAHCLLGKPMGGKSLTPRVNPWISREALSNRPALVKMGMFLLLVGVIVLAAVMWLRVRSCAPPVFRWFSAATGAVLAAIFVVTFIQRSLARPAQLPDARRLRFS